MVDVFIVVFDFSGDTLVSVKYIERDQFLLTKNIRKEIKAIR